MYEYIKGKITELTPAYTIVEANGIGYYIHITLNSFSWLQKKTECKLYIHQSIREDAHIFFGFSNINEREMFRLLISVSGVGPNTARMMLSSMPSSEVRKAILNDDVNALKSIKGIGAKSAQRIIVDLKDKVALASQDEEILTLSNNTLKNETLSALDVLGFAKKHSEKIIDKLISQDPDITVEELIKKALKVL